MLSRFLKFIKPYLPYLALAFLGALGETAAVFSSHGRSRSCSTTFLPASLFRRQSMDGSRRYLDMAWAGSCTSR